MRATRRATDAAQAGAGGVRRGAGSRVEGRHLPRSVRLLTLAGCCASALLIAAVPAAAHGPCGCTTPTAAMPGERLVSGYPTIRVVWNPVAADLLIGPDDLARDHVAGQPRVVLQERPRPGPASFRVPVTAPGRYLVLLYDGTEGGVHYSWDYITVRSRWARLLRRRGLIGVRVASTALSWWAWPPRLLRCWVGACSSWRAASTARRAPVAPVELRMMGVSEPGSPGQEWAAGR
jgi:hypothetical protein